MTKELRENHFRVAIFGSARLHKKDPEYTLIYHLAESIAMEGMDIVTGGGPGVMDAASRGHHEGRGKNKVHSVGLKIRLPREQMRSYHLDLEKDFSRFSNRLDYFMSLSNAIVVAPGGIGTTLEFFYTWQLMQVKHICDTPIILVGSMWKDLIKWIKETPLQRKFLNQEDLQLIFCVSTVEQAMKLIRKAHEQYKQGGKNICVNLQKYKV